MISISSAAQRPGRRLGAWSSIWALGAIWGGSFLCMRIAAASFGPLLLVELRLALGALILAPFLRGGLAYLRLPWATAIVLVAGVGSALPFVLFAWGAARAPAGIGAITNSLAPLFTALVGFLGFSERIGWRRLLALFVGLLGVVVLVSNHTRGSGILPAAIAGTAGAFCYAVNANLIRHRLQAIPVIQLAALSLAVAALLILPLALLDLPKILPPPRAWLAAGVLGMLCTGVAYVLYFRLIQRVGAAQAITCTYLIPLFGVLWAWLWLGEALTWRMGAAGILILGSVIFSQSRQAESPSESP